MQRELKVLTYGKYRFISKFQCIHIGSSVEHFCVERLNWVLLEIKYSRIRLRQITSNKNGLICQCFILSFCSCITILNNQMMLIDFALANLSLQTLVSVFCKAKSKFILPRGLDVFWFVLLVLGVFINSSIICKRFE